MVGRRFWERIQETGLMLEAREGFAEYEKLCKIV